MSEQNRKYSISPLQWAIRTLFLKKRFVYHINEQSFKSITPPEKENLIVTRDPADIRNHFAHVKRFTMNRSTFYTEKRLRQRLDNPHLTCFLAINQGRGEPVGVQWTIAADGETLWHDKLPLPPDAGLLINAFVPENHRRQGIGTNMKYHAITHLFDDRNCERVYGVVEATNLASRTLLGKYSEKSISANYLLKLFGVNILSIVSSYKGITIYRAFLRGGY